MCIQRREHVKSGWREGENLPEESYPVQGRLFQQNPTKRIAIAFRATMVGRSPGRSSVMRHKTEVHVWPIGFEQV